MTLLLAACLIGIVAGLRATTAPAMASWAAALGMIGEVKGWPAFMGYRWTPWIFTVAALGEWVTDQLPTTPSRKVPVQFAARVIMGALSGAVLGAAQDDWLAAMIAGGVGAVLGTVWGAAFRTRLARAFGKDRPAALIEDGLAVVLGLLAIGLIR